ncbi:MAG: hypothetical protein SVM80_09710 [Halobacteriota archaeon]|nr:hypothetical protein [Halobacteriota archaeon]
MREIPDEEFREAVLINHSLEREILLTERSVDGKRWGVICYNKKKAENDKAFRDAMINRSTQELEKVKEGCGKRNLKTKEQVYHAAYRVIEKHCTKRFIEVEINNRGSPRLKFQLKVGQEMIVRTTQFTDKQKEIISIIGVAPVGV